MSYQCDKEIFSHTNVIDCSHNRFQRNPYGCSFSSSSMTTKKELWSLYSLVSFWPMLICPDCAIFQVLCIPPSQELREVLSKKTKQVKL